jgi:hypothetical protein
MSDSSPVIWRYKRPKVPVPVQLPAPKSSKKKPSRRQQYLNNVLFEHQAKEAGSDDESVSGSDNSDDDDQEADLSCMTDESFSVDDDAMNVYRESLTSQASALGFGTPMAETRRGKFQSTFDQDVSPTWDFAGTVCPQNHMCKLRIYRTANRACDVCCMDIIEGTTGLLPVLFDLDVSLNH